MLSAVLGALIIAKWIDHNIILNGSAEKVKAKLNSMAGRVQTVLQENSTSEDGCSSSSDHDHAIKILEGVKQVMYEEEQFSGNSDDYYNIDNSLINQVKMVQSVNIMITYKVLLFWHTM